MKGLSRRSFLGAAGALGLGWHAWAAAPEPPRKRFSIAVINDIHVTDEASTEILRKAVKQINDLPDVRFTVVAGDITEDCGRKQFAWAKQALSGLARPFMAVPGNHDVTAGTGLAYTDYIRNFGERNWVREVEGWSFIGLDSCQGPAMEVSIPAVRLAWLKEQLEKIPRDRPIALFAHHPFNPHVLQYAVKNADKVLALFSEHKLKLVACGHWHGNQVETENGILFTTTACCSSTRDNHDFTTAKGFRLFHFQDDQVDTEFVTVEDVPKEEQPTALTPPDSSQTLVKIPDTGAPLEP